MKSVLVLLAVFCIAKHINAQSFPDRPGTRIYLVRHAEKESGKDPVLTAAGKQRAGDLVRVLSAKGIQRIYVSQFLRTQMTADSMRIQLGIDTVHYMADTTGGSLFTAISAHHDWGRSILVVGHSNTILRIAARLGARYNGILDIPDNEFDNLYMIKLKKKTAGISTMKYGAVSKASTPSGTMQ